MTARQKRARWTVAALTAVAAAGASVWWLEREQRPSSSSVVAKELSPIEGALIFPEDVRQAPDSIRELYEFAARRPDVLRYMPCFCGCWRAGHRSNYDCFIDRVHPDGRVEIDGMGFT